MTEEFKILTPRAHIRKRIGMYLGSPSQDKLERFVKGEWKEVTYVPALNKVVDEILDNSVDEAVRTKFQYANKINVSINGDEVTVTDNGRGIPQDNVVDPNTNKEVLRPVAAWTQVNAGTSFADDRVTIGANGVGSSCVNFTSTKFVGETWRDGKLVQIVCTDGANDIKVKEKTRQGSGTSVTFIPDFSLFEVSSLSELDTIDLIEDRIINLQMAFPEISFSFNGKRVAVNNLKKYAQMFTDEAGSVVINQTADMLYFFTSSADGFRSNSFINGVNTRQGGTYVDYVVNSVTDELMAMIKRKHKIEVPKSTIKSGLSFVMFARNFVDPKFDSQTKERLTSTQSSVKEHYAASNSKEFKYIANKIMSSEDIIEPIIEAQLAKKMAADKRAATLAQKKLKKVKVAKHISASSDKATLFLVEGDSAIGFLLKVRDPKMVGAYPLRGVIMNTWDMKPSDVLKNKELSELIAILGLDINDPNSVDDMNYQHVAVLTDADQDGAGHISPLLIAFFYKFWPRLVNEKKVHITRSPIMISTSGKDTQWFYTYDAANDFKADAKGYYHRYIKGLGSLTEEEYDSIINKPKFDTVVVDKSEYFDMMFGNNADARKEFMLNG